MLQAFVTAAQEKQHGVAHSSTVGKTVQVAPAVAPLMLLDPTGLRAKPTLARGSWVWFVPNKDYEGQDSIAVGGPAESSRHLHRLALTGMARPRAWSSDPRTA